MARDGKLALRWLALVALAGAAIPLYVRLRDVAVGVAGDGTLFLWPGLGVTLVATAAGWLVLRSRPAPSARARWIELAMIAAGGVAFRALLLGTPPGLSHDAYRYVWDAHLVAHGVSPYTHPVNDPALIPYRDGAIWPLVNWRDAVTIYPPGAEAFYLLVNAVAPLSISVLQLAMAGCDLLCGVLTVVLLCQRGLDPRRAVIYWWCPVPVLEFTFSAHVDAVATLWVLAALVAAGARGRAARVAAGIFLGLAALTKLYPLLFVAALARWRDWGLALGLAGAAAALVLPFVPLGLGNGGFLGTYFAQRFADQGLAFHLITALFVSKPIQLALQALGLLSATALVAWLRHARGLSPGASMLALSAAWIALAPHLLPWYVGGLFPLLALELRRPALPLTAPSARVLALWLFALWLPFTYVIFAPGQNAGLFPLFFVLPLVLAAVPALAQRLRMRPAVGVPASSHSLSLKE